MEAHVSNEKKRVVQEFVSLINSYPIIGIVDVENLPAPQLQNMRAALREQGIVLKMTKQRLIFKAFAEAKKEGIENLSKYTRGMPALIFTKENPFALFKLLKKSQSKAPIKGGQTAPDDIIVPAGPTSFAPGPVIGELGSVGIKTGVENGKIAIKEDSKVASAGDVVSAKLAGLLTRLGIEPMRIGLALTGVYENGEILTGEVLDIDEEAYKANIVNAHNDALSLALEIAYPTSDTTTKLIQRAFMDSTTLALERNIVNKESIEPIIGKAYAMSLALSGLLPNEALSAEINAVVSAATVATDNKEKETEEEKKEEKKPEEAVAGLGSLFG